MNQTTFLAFPSICATLGGAEWVQYGVRYAKIKLPGRVEPIRLLLSSLPKPDKWTAFTLADIAAKAA